MITATRLTRVTRDQAERIAADVACLGGKTRTEAVRRWADLHGITPASMSRWLRRVGCRTRAVNRRRGRPIPKKVFT